MNQPTRKIQTRRPGVRRKGRQDRWDTWPHRIAPTGELASKMNIGLPWSWQFLHHQGTRQLRLNSLEGLDAFQPSRITQVPFRVELVEGLGLDLISLIHRQIQDPLCLRLQLAPIFGCHFSFPLRTAGQ